LWIGRSPFEYKVPVTTYTLTAGFGSGNRVPQPAKIGADSSRAVSGSGEGNVKVRTDEHQAAASHPVSPSSVPIGVDQVNGITRVRLGANSERAQPRPPASEGRPGRRAEAQKSEHAASTTVQQPNRSAVRSVARSIGRAVAGSHSPLRPLVVFLGERSPAIVDAQAEHVPARHDLHSHTGLSDGVHHPRPGPRRGVEGPG